MNRAVLTDLEVRGFPAPQPDVPTNAMTPALAESTRGRWHHTGAPRPPGNIRARPQGRVLFIDFDGVLHPATSGPGVMNSAVLATPLWGWVPTLARVLRPHADVGLVVHSSWRCTHNVEELRSLLGPLGSRVVGSTPDGQRYESCLRWLRLNPTYTSYRILDDDRREFPDPLPAELILCDPNTGVSAPAVLAALSHWLAG